MKVRELVAKLQGLPPDMRVITDVFEGGYGDIYEVKMVRVVFDYRKDDHYQGDHEIVTDKNAKDYAGYPQHHAVYIR